MKRLISAIALSTLAFTSAFAAPIHGLYNTGAGASGTIDAHYGLLVMEGQESSNQAWISDDSQVRSQWLANDSASKWITPYPDAASSLDRVSNGAYLYMFDFNLSAEQVNGASFSARVAADNEVDVYLNAEYLGKSTSFDRWTNLSATKGFVTGVNALRFVVTNFAQADGNPSGLRFEFTGSNAGVVPEPETYAMLLGGLALLGGVARRKSRV
jgi:hypothetical protein